MQKEYQVSVTQIDVTLTGITAIMFDRYSGDNNTELPPERKFYFLQDGKTVMLPAANIMSFLGAENTESAPKRFLDSRQYKRVAHAMTSYVSVSPSEIPFASNNKPLMFDGFDEEVFYIDKRVARLKGGIPNPKVRPVIRMPWELSFELSVFPNDEFSEDMLYDLVVKGGIAIGLGTFRGVYGKFQVSKWEKK